MLRVVINSFVLWALTNFASGQGICSRPFEEFLQCTKAITDQRLENFKQESSGDVQAKIRSCFATNGCGFLDFQGANLYGLLGTAWATRIQNVMDLVENTTPVVRDCMVDFLVGFAAEKVEKCIRAQKVSGSSRFRMPPLPLFRQLDVGRLKNSTVHRIFVTMKAATCSLTKSDHTLRNMMGCVRTARSDWNEQVCKKVGECREQKITAICSAAYYSVKEAACECFKNEWQTDPNENSQYMKDIVTLFIKGRLVNEYKACSRNHNVPVPAGRLALAQESIRASVRDYVANGLPNHVRQISSQMVAQIAGEIQTTLCGKCSPPGSLQIMAADAHAVRAMAQAMNTPPQTNGGIMNTLQKGLSGLFNTFNPGL